MAPRQSTAPGARPWTPVKATAPGAYLGLPFPVLVPRGAVLPLRPGSLPLVARVRAFLVSLFLVSFFAFLVRERATFSFRIPLSFFPRAAFLSMFLFSIWFFLLPVSSFTFFFVEPVLKRIIFAVAILQLRRDVLKNELATVRHAVAHVLRKAKKAAQPPLPIGLSCCGSSPAKASSRRGGASGKDNPTAPLLDAAGHPARRMAATLQPGAFSQTWTTASRSSAWRTRPRAAQRPLALPTPTRPEPRQHASPPRLREFCSDMLPCAPHRCTSLDSMPTCAPLLGTSRGHPQGDS